MSNKKLLFTLALLGVCAIAVSGFALGARSVMSRAASSYALFGRTSTSSKNPVVATQEREGLTALVFVVRPFGFTPNDITVAAGRYLIVLQNRSGRRDLTFRIDRENGERLHEGRSERLDWKRQFDLQPGNYIVSEISHPEWSCLIRVTSR
jgi:hypothetical protein